MEYFAKSESILLSVSKHLILVFVYLFLTQSSLHIELLASLPISVHIFLKQFHYHSKARTDYYYLPFLTSFITCFSFHLSFAISATSFIVKIGWSTVTLYDDNALETRKKLTHYTVKVKILFHEESILKQGIWGRNCHDVTLACNISYFFFACRFEVGLQLAPHEMWAWTPLDAHDKYIILDLPSYDTFKTED